MSRVKKSDDATLALRLALERNHALARRTRESDFPLEAFERLQVWQRRRLAVSYADLLSEAQFSAAGHFFLEELYGGLDFRERDQQVSRVMPVMTRTLPAHMLHALAGAFELQALSLELDMDMTGHLLDLGDSELDPGIYQQIYAATGRPGDRERQIELIRTLGLELNEVVRHRRVLQLVRILRLPARAAGFGLLQDFLEEGLSAFRQMRDGERFVETVYRTELEIMGRLFRGATDPFRV